MKYKLLDSVYFIYNDGFEKRRSCGVILKTRKILIFNFYLIECDCFYFGHGISKDKLNWVSENSIIGLTKELEERGINV